MYHFILSIKKYFIPKRYYIYYERGSEATDAARVGSPKAGVTAQKSRRLCPLRERSDQNGYKYEPIPMRYLIKRWRDSIKTERDHAQ